MDIKEQIETLKSLQQIELKSRSIRSDIKALSGHVREVEEELDAEDAVIAERRARLDALRREYRDLDAAGKDALALSRKTRDKLHSVKTNREYQALLKAIDDLKFQQSKGEDRMLAMLEEIEGLEAELAEAEARRAALEEKVAGERRAFSDESLKGENNLSALKSRWDREAAGLEPSLMNRFVQLKEKVSPIAVAPVARSVCQGCNMNIPPQLFIELQRFDSLRTCPYCQRIIYWEQPAE